MTDSITVANRPDAGDGTNVFPGGFSKADGRLAQLVRAPALHAGGHWFDSSTAHIVGRAGEYGELASHFLFDSAKNRID